MCGVCACISMLMTQYTTMYSQIILIVFSKKVHISCKQLDFKLLDFCIQPMSIQVHQDFLDKLEGVLEVVRKIKIKSINETEQHDECQDHAVQVPQNLNALDHNSYVCCTISSLDFVNPHFLHPQWPGQNTKHFG